MNNLDVKSGVANSSQDLLIEVKECFEKVKTHTISVQDFLIELRKCVENAKTLAFPGEMLIYKEPVIDELGEIRYDGYLGYHQDIFPDIPYRTPRDLKYVDDREISTQPSELDLTNYADNRDTIKQLMRNLPQAALIKISNDLSDGEYSSDKVNLSDEYDEFDESAEPLDNLTYISEMNEQAIQAQKNKQSPKNEQASADEDKRSVDEDKQASE